MVQSELIKENSADEVYILAPLIRSLKCQGVYFTIKEKVFAANQSWNQSI